MSELSISVGSGSLKTLSVFPSSLISLPISLHRDEIESHIGRTISWEFLSSQSYTLSKWPLKAKEGKHFVRKDDPELLARELAEILGKPNLHDTVRYINGKSSVDIADLMR